MEDADFLKAARTMLDAAERADEHVRAAPSTWRRLLEMAERWHAATRTGGLRGLLQQQRDRRVVAADVDVVRPR